MFLIEKYIEEVWHVSQRNVIEEFIARETAKKEATLLNPTRVINLEERRVICCYTAEGVDPPEGWDHYGFAVNQENEEEMDTKESSPAQPTAPTAPTAPTTPTAPVPVQGSTAPVVAPEGQAQVTVPVVTPTAPTPPAVQELLEGTDDGPSVPEEPIWDGVPFTGTFRVAMLFSGGLSSTATLLYLIKKGYMVTPYYVFDENFERSEREMKIARSIIRTLRSTKRVEKLRVIETKISKQQVDRRRRRYIELLTKEVVGLGFNGICYGSQSIEPSEEVEDDVAADTDVLFLQETTPLEVISPGTLEAGEVEDILKAIPLTPTAKSALFRSTSCDDPGSKECGDCDRCRRRFRFFMRVLGEDKTKYLKGSKVRVLKAKLAEFVEAKRAKNEPYSWEDVKAIIYPQKKKG